MSNPEIGLRARRRIANLVAVALAVATLVSSALVGLSAVGRASAAGGTPNLASAPGSGWIPDVPVAADVVWAERNPSLTTAANGDVYLAFETDASGSRDIYFTRSSDGGQTWSTPVAAAVTAVNEVNPSIATDPYSGRIFIAYQLGTSGATRLLVAYSDDGLAWTTANAFTCGVYCERPRIASEYWNGASNRQYIVFAGEISAGSDWNMAVLRSTSQGASWSFLYEDGLGFTDVRHHPDVAVQRGTDGVDRVLMFYRYGASVPGTTGRMGWSTNYGATWNAPSVWSAGVDTPPVIAAAHDGDSVMIAYGSGSDVIWAADSDPTNLVWGAGTFWGQFPSGGAGVALAVDGDGSTNLSVGGAYHLVSQFAGGPLSYETAPVNLAGAADWSAPLVISDAAAAPSAAYPKLTVASQFRNGTWFPGVAWTDDRAGNNDVYYTTPGGFVAPGPITVTIDSVPSGLRVSLDGATRIAPAVYSVAAGLHTVSVTSPQAGAPGWRYTFASWSDGGTMSHVIDVTANMTITTSFTTEVFLTVTSARGGVTGGGWYALGAMATVTATTPQAGPPGTQYAFTGWTGDLVSPAASASLMMDAPKAVTANWQTQFFLTVNSARGGVIGAGWYNDGVVATFTVTSPQSAGPGTRYLFSSWTGDVNSPATSATILMDAPKTVTANWQTQYLLTVNSARGGVSGGGWYDAFMRVLVLANTPQSGPTGTRYAFAGWTGDALGTSTGVYLTMDSPKTVIATWRTEFQLIVNTAHGKATGGGWYAQGAVAMVVLNATEIPEGDTTWAFAGWTGDGSGNTASLSLTMDAPKTLVASWQVKASLANTGVVLVGPIVLLVAILLLLTLLKRRKKKVAPTYTQMQPMAGYGTTAPPPTQPMAPPPPSPSTPEMPPPSPLGGPPS